MIPYKVGIVRVTSPYGKRTDPVTGELNVMHPGIDLVGTDKQIVAVMGGTVLRSRRVWDAGNPTSEWGEYVSISGDDGKVIYYCHMSTRKVVQGQRVEAGELIGIEGSTGKSTGSHCHFEVRNGAGTAIDPAEYLGIRNAVQSIDAGKAWADWYAEKVCGKVGLESQTRAYLDKYKYAPDLWRKLWEAMA